MKKSAKILIVVFLTFGVLYRLFLTWDNNFLFNMDNARDMVDVREMIELKKIRLIGPTSAIEGFYNGPGWYLLLAIPYIVTSGNPYGSILTMIILWAIGGFCLFKLTSRYGIIPSIFVGLLWVFSNYITLATSYAFNPNPVTLLTPLFILLLDNYIRTNKVYYAAFVGLLGGLFFNFEMNIGVFMPLVIFSALVFAKKFSFLKEKNFWICVFFFALCLLPQLIFDIRHNFIMSNSVIRYITNGSDVLGSKNPVDRFFMIWQTYYNVLTPTFLNSRYLLNLTLISIIVLSFFTIKSRKWIKDSPVLIALLLLLIPFIGYTLLPVNVNPWHLGAPMSAFIFLSGFVLYKLSKLNILGKILVFALIIMIVIPSFNNISDSIRNKNKENTDPSLFRNELSAVDFVYQKAEGKDFKAYVYLPSVIDYPYQYLFWWRGMKHYGYTPIDYVYLPNKPQYISNKEQFVKPKNGENSHLVFLIKEPDRIGYRKSWEDNFAKLQSINYQKFGDVEVEIRKEIP